MRTIGYLLLFLACAGGGWYGSLLLEKRKQQLLGLLRMAEYLSREIDYQLSPLGEAFYHTARRLEEPWKGFCLRVSARLEENLKEEREGEKKEDFMEIWEEQVAYVGNYHLWKKDLEILKRMGKGLGQLDKEMQLLQLRMAKDEIEEARLEACEEKKKKGRLYPMLGTCMGALGILLLL